MKETSKLHQLFIKLLKKLGIIETHTIDKAEMCKRTRNICNMHCDSCAWNIRNGDEDNE